VAVDRDALIRLYRGQGMPEADAIRKAHQGSQRAPEEEDDAPETPVRPEDADAADDSAGTRRFVVVTKDFTGLGWAKKLDEEGEDVTLATDYSEEEDPKLKEQMMRVGEGWLPVVQLSEAVKTLQSDNTIWIFAENCFVEEAEKLIEAGQKVFPPSITLGEKMEHDRDFAVGVAEDAGLPSPPTHEFSSRDEGLKFLDANKSTAYVMKINDNKFNFQTFVPNARTEADAHEQLYVYLKYMDDEPTDYILQERIPIEDALEVNVELWFFEGEPFLATLGLEVKRKNTYDVGEMTGCAGDFTQFIPLDSPLVEKTIGKLGDFYREQKYTGFADVNVIFTKDNQPHFLEVCNRFGYNSHPNMFLGLCRDNFGDVIADYLDGNVSDMASRFRTEIGCSLTLFIDHPRPGLPIFVKPDAEEQFYTFDGLKKEDQLLMTGYSDEIGIFLTRGKDIQEAWDKMADAVAMKEKVIFPDIYYRWDLAEDNYYNAPILRYQELKKRGLLK